MEIKDLQCLEEEVWALHPIGLYVSNLGRIYVPTSGKHKAHYTYGCDCKGYKHVQWREKIYKVHRLVAECFLENPDNLPCVNHKDEDKQNNNVDNLEYCTHQYNMNYGTAIERRVKHTDYKARTAKIDYKAIAAKTAIKKSIPINQYLPTGEFIEEWTSATEVERELGYAQQNICNCCKGKRKSAYGYLWKYA